MAKFKPASGFGAERIVKEFPIVTDTAIELGEIVGFTPGTGIVAATGTDFDDPAIGVALEEHDGSSDGQTGTTIKVECNPNTIYSLKSTFLITATGGSTSTFVDSTLLPQTDNLHIGAYLEVVSCASGIAKGTMIPVTDSTGATGTLTFAVQASAFAADDTAYLHLGKPAITEYGWDLDSDGTDVDITTSGGEALQLVDADPENKLSYWKLRLHQFGNDAAAK